MSLKLGFIQKNIGTPFSGDELFWDSKKNKKSDIKCAIIPHAGLAYCAKYIGPILSSINWNNIDKILILSTNHHPGDNYCMNDTIINYANKNIKLKSFQYCTINSTIMFKEHSWQIILPYLGHIFGGERNITLIPIILGKYETSLRTALASYIRTEKNLFVLGNTDLIHCGTKSYGKFCNHNMFNNINNMVLISLQYKMPEESYTYNNKIHGAMCGHIAMAFFFNVIPKNWKYINHNIKIIDKFDPNEDTQVGYCSIAYGIRGAIIKSHILEIPRRFLYFYDHQILFDDNYNNFINRHDIMNIQNYNIFVTIIRGTILAGCIGVYNENNTIYKICSSAYKSANMDSRFLKKADYPIQKEDLKNLLFKINFIHPRTDIIYSKNNTDNIIEIIKKHIIMVSSNSGYGITITFNDNKNATYLASVMGEHFGGLKTTKLILQMIQSLYEKSGGNSSIKSSELLKKIKMIEKYYCTEYTEFEYAKFDADFEKEQANYKNKYLKYKAKYLGIRNRHQI